MFSKRLFLCMFFIGVACPPNSPATESPSPVAVRVAQFQGNRAGAISYTFDDGLRNQILLAAPILNELGLRATFFIVPQRIPDTKAEAEAKKPGEMGGICWDDVRELSRQGHEIGNHTWSHTALLNLDETKAREELSQADHKIEKETGVFPLSFCYPGNMRDARSRSLALERHVEAREYETRMGSEHKNPDALNAWADRQAAEHVWGVAMIHGLVDGFDPIDPAVLRAHLTYVKNRNASLWIDTFGNVARYIRERDAAQIHVLSQTAESITFVVNTPLERPPFDVPLTLLVDASGVVSAEAKNETTTLPCTVAGDLITVECMPSPSSVIVRWKTNAK